MRPGEPTRSTLPRWVQVCAGCGAAAPDLAALDDSAREVVRGDAYRSLAVEPADAVPFLRWAMLAQGSERAEALLQAAWMADDAGMDARALRLRAAAVWPEATDTQGALRLIDVLRRAGAFDEARGRADALAGAVPDETSARVLAFQRARIDAGDTGRHLLSSALRPPAAMPHVAHGGRAGVRDARGFWGRLLGGR